MDIVVTTPRRAMKAAAAEAAAARAAADRGERSRYFRRFPGTGAPVALRPGDWVWYVEDGALRGRCRVVSIASGLGRRCDTTGRPWPAGVYVEMDPRTWEWIEPAPLRGFQGFRYFCRGAAARWFGPGWRPRVVGGWRDPRPEAEP